MTPDPSLVASLAAARATVLERIASACARVGRDPAAVALVAVSKTVEPGILRAAVAAGLVAFGENRVQEALAKAPAVPGAAWHLVGHLQGNKARPALAVFEFIESVDSLDLARRLDRLVGEGAPLAPAVAPLAKAVSSVPGQPDPRLPILFQVNVDADPAKAGFSPAGLAEALPELLALPRLEARGLMTVGRLVDRAEEARPTFVALRGLSESLRATAPGLGAGLSMGMTDDFEVAVEEGATIVRVGRAIFGERPHTHQPGGPAHRH